MPKLSSFAENYLSLTAGSCEAERSFSLYKNVMTDKRKQATEESVKMMTNNAKVQWWCHKVSNDISEICVMGYKIKTSSDWLWDGYLRKTGKLWHSF